MWLNKSWAFHEPQLLHTQDGKFSECWLKTRRECIVNQMISKISSFQTEDSWSFHSSNLYDCEATLNHLWAYQTWRGLRDQLFNLFQEVFIIIETTTKCLDFDQELLISSPLYLPLHKIRWTFSKERSLGTWILLFYRTYVNFKNCPLEKLVEKWKGNHHMCNGMCESMH